MTDAPLQITYLGGPTALLEVDGLRLLTDPTFDPAGTMYPTGQYTLRKTQGPARLPEALGHLDAVLLSHDHHFDNLDHAGRALLEHIDTILTTPAGAHRVGDKATGLVPWQSIDLPTRAGSAVRVTGTPARHGPVDGDRGPVTGFVLTTASLPGAVYLSGDTVWYEGIAEVGQRFSVHVALLFMGAARVVEVGPAALTFTAAEAVDAARAFAKALVIPLHYEGWAHFTESRQDIARTFAAAGLERRLRWLEPGRPMAIVGEPVAPDAPTLH